MDKPEGPTSHDVVARARRLFGTRAVGHTGTLDPFATGLLILVFGGATRLARWAERHRKTYRGVIRLGRTTDTDDLTGATLAECVPLYGDELEAPFTWKGGADISAISGKPVRLRFFLRDADLYAMQAGR